MRVIYVLFLLSGAAGLVYQIVWSRMLNDVFGVTVYAVTTVLATFLGGLALGGVILGRLADRQTSSLRFYGLLEIGIGLAALAGTWAIRALDPLHIWAASRLAADSASLIGTRFLLASLIVLPPTFLMGGTLPVVTRVFVDHMGQLGRQLSLLYALNTVGAVVGTLAAGFLLIRTLGLHPTLWMAVTINLAVGVVSIGLAARRDPLGGHESDVSGIDRTSGGPVDRMPAVEGFGLLIVMGLSGFVSLGLEVIWTRVLVLFIGTTTYAFVTMLSSFLVGIALGSLIARLVVDRPGNLRRAFGWIQVGIAASTLATIPVIRALISHALSWHEGLELHWFALIASRFGASFLIMLVPTTLIGMTFPVAGKLWTRELPRLGGQVGQVYGANTLGNILGTILTGFVLLPAAGLQKGVAMLAPLSLICAAWGFKPSAVGRRRPEAHLGAVFVAAGIVLFTFLLFSWQPSPFPAETEQESDPVLYYKEGIVATVKVVQRAYDSRQLWMAVDGIKIGESSGGVDRKQQVLAHLPFVLAPDGGPRKVLSIGFGTGILIGQVAKHEGVHSVDCIEISPSVIEAARIFGPYNGNALDDPTVRIINDDGINFLKRSRQDYDAIISDAKSRTAHAGNAHFFSQDYYGLCRNHLRDGGMMIQWVPLDLPPEELRIICRTFIGVFPYGYVWFAHESCFLVGVETPLVLDVAHIQRVLDDPATGDLKRYGWGDAYDVVSMLVADDVSLARWLSQESSINSREKPTLEFYSPRAHAVPVNERAAENMAAIHAVFTQDSPRDMTLAGADTAAVVKNARAVGWFIEGLALLQSRDANLAGKGARLLERALEEAPSHGVLRYDGGRAFFKLGLSLQVEGRIDDAIARYLQALRAWPDHAETHNNLGGALVMQGRFDEAIYHFRRALDSNAEFGGAHNNLGKALLAMGRADEAIEHFREALRIGPALADPRRNLGVALSMVGQLDKAP